MHDYEWESEQYRQGRCANCAENFDLLTQTTKALEKLLVEALAIHGDDLCDQRTIDIARNALNNARAVLAKVERA